MLGRLKAHLGDRHGEKWDRLAIYIIDEKLKLHDVESLLISVSKPQGNRNRGKIKGNLRKDLREYLKAAAIDEIEAALGPDREPRQSKKSRRITENKIEAFIKSQGVAKTADVLGVSSGRVSQLRGGRKLRRWVIAAGKREKLLLAMERAGQSHA